MRVTVHKDLKLTEFRDVIQVSVIVSEVIDELEMPQETIIHIITKNGDEKKKTAILCDSSVILTVVENENAPL